MADDEALPLDMYDPTWSSLGGSLFNQIGFENLSDNEHNHSQNLKALTLLSTLFRKNSGSELCQIAPQWVFEFKKLVQDNSR